MGTDAIFNALIEANFPQERRTHLECIARLVIAQHQKYGTGPRVSLDKNGS